MDNPHDRSLHEPELAPEPAGDARASAPGQADPLLEAVLWLCRHHGVMRSEQSLLDGQALDRGLTADQALQVLRQAGFSATLERVRLQRQRLG